MDVGKMYVFNQKLAISGTVRDNGQVCYQSLIESGIRPFRWDENHWPWMTLKVGTRYCG